jgi:diguanylate cyclase (GGDEF)-like protein
LPAFSNIDLIEGFDMLKKDSKKLWKWFSLNISLVLLLFILGIFSGVFINNERLINSELETRARSHFNNIVLTRSWSAGYGGVYVEKLPGVISNPYLDDPDVETTDGVTLTLKNPALMTREISELAGKNGDFQFHITSLKLKNPDNAPDAFEKSALESFEKGVKEIFSKEYGENKTYFRYMAPLKVEKSCLECHRKQGYRAGDVRGGISVKFEISEVQNSLQTNRIILAVLFVATTILLLSIIYFFIVRVSKKLERALQDLNKMATTDELTGLYNRRHFFSRLDEEINRCKRYDRSLSCLMLDIDFFKKVNDTYGHDAGDLVLQEVSRVLKSCCRSTDTVARYGGEEFIHLLQETNAAEVMTAAEKIRQKIEECKTTVPGAPQLRITASIGVITLSGDSLGLINEPDDILRMVDAALYRAKEKGRNRVEVASTPTVQE